MPFALGYKIHEEHVECPSIFEELKQVAFKLAKGFPHVRIDLYVSDNRVYFGEMTFSHSNGTQKFNPDEWDYKLGALWPFDNSVRKKVLAENHHI